MRLLLDTHILLWWLGDERKLPARARGEVSDRNNEILVSSATVWECAIKANLGRLQAPDNLPDEIENEDFRFLLVTPDHAWMAGFLPAHHQDPFDRMLAAQAVIEDVSLVSVDDIFDLYEVPRLPL